jgi:hypothetical protein
MRDQAPPYQPASHVSLGNDPGHSPQALGGFMLKDPG